MSNTTTSPFMGMPVPNVLQDPGPTWATDLNSCLALLDSHTHVTGQGQPITPNGLNINSDLTFQQNNILLPRSVRFYQNASPLALVSDLRCAYVSGSDLYYNDGSGNQVRITQSGSVVGPAGTITGLPSGTASAAFVAASGSFVFQQATSTGANLDVASIAIRYPGSYPTPTGNYIQLQAPASLASGYALTLPPLPGSTSFLVMTSAGIISAPYATVQGIIGSMLLNGTITSTQIANNTITATQIANATLTGTQMASSINLPGNTVQENGKNVVVSNTNAAASFCVLRGTINGAGSPTAGEGFTSSRFSQGRYNITFTTAFADAPIITLTTHNNGIFANIEAGTVSTGGFNLQSYDHAGAIQDADINFIAIGQRA